MGVEVGVGVKVGVGVGVGVRVGAGAGVDREVSPPASLFTEDVPKGKAEGADEGGGEVDTEPNSCPETGRGEVGVVAA